MKKMAFRIFKVCSVATMLCMAPPTNALRDTSSIRIVGGDGGDDLESISSSPNNGSTSSTSKPLLSVTDVQSYLSSFGTTLDDVCSSHYHHHHISQHRGLNTDGDQEDATTIQPGVEAGEEKEQDSKQAVYINTFMAVLCVCVAALAAGLTMGLLSQELLDLRIKEMASADLNERKQAGKIVPLIKDHHRLLVTLLLMNALANEALPLFLDELVPSYVAIIMSVTFVLFFGEIIPSAIFTGPNQLAISSKLAPLVRLVLVLLAPIAWPIAKILDFFLHDAETLEKYDRGELKALVRLQFEEKKKAKLIKKAAGAFMRGTSNDAANAQSNRFVRHIDEVNMVEGALQMHTKKVGDVMQNWRKVYAIPSNTILNEANILDIYSSGHSRIPVFQSERKGAKGGLGQSKKIIGLFKARQLAVISAEEERPLSSIHLAKPACVGPTMNMVDLLNLLQDGKGLMAIVCIKPKIAEDAISANKPIPEEAYVVGLITLEDCIEELIQEEIYDEYDREEKINNFRSKWVIEKWKRYTEKKKAERQPTTGLTSDDINENTQLIV